MKRKITVTKKEDAKAYMKAYHETTKAEKKRVSITLPMPEYERLKALASRSKVRPTQYAYRVVMAAVDERLKRFVPSDAMLTLLLQKIRPIATNFNQLVRKGNALGVNAGIMEIANGQLKQIRQLVEGAFDDDSTMEQRISAYLWRDPEAYKEVERIIANYKAEKGL